VLHKVLDHRRASDEDREQLCDYAALYKGGKAFHARLDRFLPQRPSEEGAVYAFRKKSAHYLNYAGPVINYFAAKTFLDEPEVTSDPKTVDDWYAAWRDNCDGLGTDLVDVVHERVKKALVEKRSWLLVDFPATDAEPANRADWEQRGLGDAYLCPFDDCDVLDWSTDDRGELEWVITKQRDTRRRDPRQLNALVTDTWTIWTRDGWERFAIEYDPSGKDPNKPPPKDDDAIPSIATGPVATPGRVPFVRIELPDELWAMNIIADPQLEQTRSRNALSWGLARSCFAQRIFKLHEAPGEDGKDSAGGGGPKQGPGYGMIIGVDEDVIWDAPPVGAFAPNADYARDLKDEIYRVAHQMALGVENNAAAVGRSAESKNADDSATTVVVRALAKRAREIIKRIYDLVSLGRGDEVEWKIGGMSCDDADDEALLTTDAVALDGMAYGKTWRKEFRIRVALAKLPDATPEQRDAIRKEIEEIVDQEPDEPVEPTAVNGNDPNADPAEPDADDEPAIKKPPQAAE